MGHAWHEVVGQAKHHEVRDGVPGGFDPAGQVDGFRRQALPVGVFARNAQREPDPLRVAEVETGGVDFGHVAQGFFDALAHLDGEVLLQFAFAEILRALGEGKQGEAEVEEVQRAVLVKCIDYGLEVLSELFDMVVLAELPSVLLVGLVLVGRELEGVGQRIVEVLGWHALAQ